MKEGGKERTHLDVRLLITPVDVLYCSARAKMAAIPRKLYAGRQPTMWASTSQALILTNSRIKIWHYRRQRNNHQKHSLAPRTPSLRIQWRIGGLGPEDEFTIGGQFEFGKDGGRKFVGRLAIQEDVCYVGKG